ncbi:nonsense-mediated mRNA decay factor SMG5-like isoform X2 [Lineus longissimus]
MFYNPIEYGRRAEELLWRKVFYDIIQLAKHNRKQLHSNSGLECAVRTHLAAAAGYYHHLLLRLQYQYEIRLEDSIDLCFVPEPRSYKKSHQIKKHELPPEILEWAKRACHRCLIYLGDIARYQQEFDGIKSRILSRRYYYQALALLPDTGMPHNQLGTLAGSSYYNCTAAYYYMRCLLCETSFEGAQGNMKRLFEKNRKRHTEVSLSSPRDLPPEQQRYKDIKRCIVGFMYLLDVLHFNTQNLENKELQECCQTTLQDFNLCMYYQPPQNTINGYTDELCKDDKGPYLDNDIVFKMVVMCIMTVHNLNVSGSKFITAAMAFSLALFSHVLNHVVNRVQTAIYEAENPRKELAAESPVHSNSSESESPRGNERHVEFADEVKVKWQEIEKEEKSDNREENEKSAKKKKLMLQRLERRRRRRSGESDDLEMDSDPDCDVPFDTMFSDSDEDEALNYLGESDSSNDSDDNLMESQELRPGFAAKGGQEQNSANQNDILSSDLNPINEFAFFGTFDDNLPKNPFGSDRVFDITQESVESSLQEYSSEFFTNSDCLPHIRFGHLSSQRDQDDMLDFELCQDVVQGKKQVTVPPGFDQDPESKYVEELAMKLATFNIETDTEGSLQPTDTENSSLPTESDTQDADASSDESLDSVIDRNESEGRRVNRLVDIITREGLLPTIKVFCDWMICHNHIVETCAQSSHSLWTRLSMLLNMLPTEEQIATPDICTSDECLRLLEQTSNIDWCQKQPLSEDLSLQNVPPLRDVHNCLQFDSRHRVPLDERHETLIRICCLLKFGSKIAEVKSVPLTFNDRKHKFFGPLNVDSNFDEESAQEKLADTEARRNQLMRDMAHLRLQAEVNQLEGSLKLESNPNLPPYLIPDASALTDGLDCIKHMANSARFIIIIPLAVIDNLDLLKKDSCNAREAIRWLEMEFKKGNRYVRAQKSNEKSSASPQKNLKRKDREAWYFLQAISCCKYFAHQQSEYSPKDMVSYLTNQPLDNPNLTPRMRGAVAAMKQDGISIEMVKDFYIKWKDTLEKDKG